MTITIDHRPSTIYSTCLHCTKDLGTNDVIETLPVGRRLAFDESKGRLWVVCRHCAKWNLVPFDTRLETIDACERLFRDTRTRFSTDNIGVARVAGGLELVRVGVALRPEFASWRYGETYRRRRRKAMLAGGVGATVMGGALLGLGAAGVAVGSMGYFLYMAIENGWKYGLNRAASIVIENSASPRPIRIGTLTFKSSVISYETGEPSLDVPLLKIRQLDHLRLAGAEFRSTGRRVLGGLNLMAGRRRDLASAAELLGEQGGDLDRWLRTRTEKLSHIGQPNASWQFPGGTTAAHLPRYTVPYLPLGMLQATERLAVEMWMNEDIERTWLEGELKLLEREWREAERLAKIADDLVLEPDS